MPRLFFEPEQILPLFKSLEEGDLKTARDLIAGNPELLVERTKFTDCTGRTFDSISPWEYLLWSANTYYPIEMIKLEPSFNSLLDKLSQQEVNLDSNGISYVFNGKEIKDKRYSLQPIIDLLQKIAARKNEVAPKELDHQEATSLWKQVKDLQNQLPKHIRFELCRPQRRWDPKDRSDTGFTLPSCHEQPFSSDLLITRRDECFNSYVWKDKKGLIEGLSLVCDGARLTYTVPFSLKPDLAFYQTLETTRSQDRYNLGNLLRTRLNELALESQGHTPIM